MLRTTLIALIAVGLSSGGVRADDPDPESERAARFATLTEHVAEYEFRIAGVEEPFELLEKPVLRWSNPVRDTLDGAVFLWTDRGRVAAAMCGFWSGDTEYKHEFQSLSEERFTTTLDGEVVWAPGAGGLEAMPLEKPTVAASRRLRLVQMRAIARMYEARLGREGEGDPLRLLRQPLHRYPETVTAPGIVDGALFAFVQTTDPEVLVRIEAVRDDEGTRWQIAFARMSRWSQSVLLQNDVVWSRRWAPTGTPRTYHVLPYRTGDTTESEDFQ